MDQHITHHDRHYCHDCSRHHYHNRSCHCHHHRHHVPLPPPPLPPSRPHQHSTLQYTTEDETAFAGEDYKLTKGTLTFKPGETKKKISVPVFNDAECEPDENFLVTLLPKTLKCKRTECGVGINAQARVFILDHDESKQGEPHAVA